MNLPFIWKRKERAPAPATADALPTATGAPARKKPRKKRVRLIAILLLVAIAAGAAAHFLFGKKTDDTAAYTDEEVTRRDITTTLTGTGTLEPINQYNVTTLAKGEVLTCTFEEGDTVEKGQLLYTIDSTDVEESIEKSRLSLQQSQLSYQQQLESLADLSVKAKKGGVITDVSVEVGDDVKAGDTIATLRDSAVMKLKVPFNSADAKSFYVGEGATVTIDGSFETLSGSITEIDGADTVLDGYQMVRYVTIGVTNPGALSPSASGTATVNGIACNSGAAFEYNAESTITAEAAGTVASVPVRSGSSVSADSVVCKMTSTSLESQVQNSAISLKNAELSLQNTIDSLDDYKVTAPISGTVVTKTTQVGDSIDSSSGVSALAVIYDMSSLTFDIALDELDVNQVQVGQEVQVEVDALDGESFTGKITKISVAGTTTNGATTYPVTVQIDNPPAELLPGMNVNASIITGKSADVLAVPVAAIQRDNLVYVKDSGTAAATTKDAAADGQDAASDTR
ncbi:MAG: HlyD family efflux transporter periplasmic adaptor subunit, partial [Intestinibacillus sp.]